MELKWKNEWTIPSIVGAASFGIGVAVGYGIRSYLNYREDKSIRESIEDVIEEDEDQLNLLDAYTPSYVSLMDDVEHVHEHVEGVIEMFSNSVEESKANHPSNGHHIFNDEEDDWDYETEVRSRTPDAPFIIHVDEYMLKEADGYSQTTLTYYQGDDVLVDEADVPIYDPKRIVGELKFGHGSRDQSICYVRNDKLEAEYEILLDHGHYQLEVLGVEIEENLNSEKPFIPKFRSE